MTKTIIGAALLLTVIAPLAHAADDGTITLPVAVVPEKRPLILPVLYASFAGLQAYDVYSTRVGVARGAAELNPLVAPAAGDTTAMVMMKAASTVTTIAVAERLWHSNKAAAIVVMVAANGVMAAVAAHNARVLAGAH